MELDKGNIKSKKRKHRYIEAKADRIPYLMNNWKKDLEIGVNSIEEMFINAVNEMNLEKVKFIINNGFIDFNNECPPHMQLVEDEYFYGSFGSIYDKAIYECLYSHVCYSHGVYMEIANELLKCNKVNYDLFYVTLSYCFDWYEKKFFNILGKVSKENSEIMSMLDRYIAIVYSDYESIDEFISVFDKIIISNGVSINHFPNLFINACWLDNKELVEFFIENNFDYRSDFDKDTMDEIIIDSSIDCKSIIQVAYNLSQIEGSKEVQQVLEKYM